MLRAEGIAAGYGRQRVLHRLDLAVAPGEIVCLMGRNGAGKTTSLRAIMGLLPLMAGRVLLDDVTLSAQPAHQVPRHGIGYVPQGRRLFGELSVAENLRIGLMARPGPPDALARVLALFPRLAERMGQRADTLSGGEQQMLAMGRALCIAPRFLLLDEPTEGLQPSIVADLRDVVLGLREQGVGILLVEQRLDTVLALADRAVLLENGTGREVLDGAALRADPALLRRRLGV
ncbi:ABC transporter ATP-binding protein [Halovulum dunhuangense]|uniref:ABC transporter ATP-binding protein n=1 Tax=Halovulum dunhuangense TaxID=1505036 RepID=A0A849L3S1_9RHOB|nr:ABC transporter ATP-binding protein [Halovulum dunhuangense]NNU80854.1 ABC transporter ATP-binding protein [Halovulum dunhuangense]